MMKYILSVLVMTTFLLFGSSCKQDQITKVDGDSSKAKVPTTVIDDKNSLLSIIKNMAKVSDGQIPGMKEDADVIMKHRLKQTGNKSYIILFKDMWEYEFIFTGKTMTKPGQLSGSWIDFKEDLTYAYGYYEKEQGSGTYTYDISSGLLLLVDNSDNVKPQEFEAKVFDKSLIMDGNEIYKDNNYNSKLRRVAERPKKIG